MRFQLVSKKSPNNTKYLKRYIKKLYRVAASHNLYGFICVKENNRKRYSIVFYDDSEIILCLQQFALDLSDYCGFYFEMDGKNTLWINDVDYRYLFG